ncbi:Xanthosine triphosphate pyrophosphatase [gamma proteobacterium HdN1]|nr:Xanthosine triphosphate pyrophosphatase [gamma proteobacterium HdN1]
MSLPRTLVIATGNAGKLREIQQILAPFCWEIVSQKVYCVTDAEETGLSFIENAILKARHACKQTGLPALADDSGIEVDALNGAPGIYSARYSGNDATDARNNQKLLDALREIPEAQRTARFQCVIALMRHANDPTPLVCQGTWEGRILHAPQGNNGFGYDPLFWVESHQCSSAELEPTVKSQISHRAQALLKLTEQMKTSLVWR